MKKEVIIGISVCAVLVIAGVVFGICFATAGHGSEDFAGIYYGNAPDGSRAFIEIKPDGTFYESCYQTSGTWEQKTGTMLISNYPESKYGVTSVYLRLDTNDSDALSMTIDPNGNYTTIMFRRSS